MKHFPVFLLGFLGALAADGAKPCVFCEIVSGQRPAAIVYRDDTVLAFMDIAPRNPGHVLVVPVRHADNLLELPPATARDMMAVAQRIALALKATDLKTEGIQVMMNTGKAAGQEVLHAHLHVIPRFIGEPEPPDKTRKGLGELEVVAAKIRAQLK